MRRALYPALLMMALARAAHGQGGDVPATTLPEMLTLDDALKIFRARGLDLLIADAAVQSAEGDTKIAGAIPNPSISVGWLHAFFNTGASMFTGADGVSLGLGDSAAIENSLSGKRGLKLAVADSALKVARLSRSDAQRTLEFQVKQVYIQAVLARDALDFALEIQKSNDQTFNLNQLRFQKGAISEADEAKVEATKLESDQAVDSATQALRVAKVSLAFLLGVRGPIPDFKVEQDLPKYSVPPSLVSASPESLLREAYDHRPDLRAYAAQRERAEAAIRLARRARFPDLSLNFSYSQQGGAGDSNPVSPPTIGLAIGGTLPIFYLQSGEIKKAEADLRTQTVARAKVEAQVSADVETAFTNFTATRQLVERMEKRLLDRVKRARDLMQLSYTKGNASLLEFLDAQRQYIATNVEYLQDLTNYWTAVYQLEQAVGVDLR